MTPQIAYPYMPEGRTIEYVPKDNPFMQLAKAFARAQSLDGTMPGGGVLVSKKGRVIGIGANGSNYHKTNTCQRVILGSKTGQDYDKCEGCHPKNHIEPNAIRSAVAQGKDTAGADIYIWGHWWCCKDCWNAMIAAGIDKVFLMEDSEVLLNKENPGNVVGKQFELA